MGASNAASQNESNILSGLTPELQSLLNSSSGTLTSGIQGILGSSGTTPYGTSAAGSAGGLTNLASSLENFQALSPQEISALSTQAGNTVSSTAKTIASQSGGVPNPALQAQQAETQAGQTTAGEASQLGSIASQQKLGALQSAGSDISGAGSLFSGLNSTSLSSMLSALGLSESALTTATSGLGNVAGLYAQQQAQADASSPLSQLGGLLGGAGTLAGASIGAGSGKGGGSQAPTFPTDTTLGGPGSYGGLYGTGK
jgi:hypothetical protein